MNNAVNGPMVKPLDLILGLLGQQPKRISTGGDPFDALLGMLSPAAGKSALAEGEAPTPERSLPAIMGDAINQVPVLIPADLAAALGISSQAGPMAPATTTGNEVMIPARGDLLMADDHNPQMLYLRLAPIMGQSAAATPVLPQAEAEGKEMILPMRLRTVEQDGNRIIAEADLITATGKEASLRIRLELAGDVLRSMGPRWSPGEKSPTITDQTPSLKAPQLTRMLGELGVKMIVIENSASVETPVMQVMPALLPGALRRPNGAVTHRAASVIPQESLDGKSDLLIAAQTAAGREAAPWPTSQVADIPKLGAESNPEPAVMTPLRPEADSAVTASQGESNRSAAMTAPINSMADFLRPSDPATGEQPQVRFYDLDVKLDQLKQNPGQKIRIQLAPANLGKMDLTIASHRGMVTVNLTVNSHQAQQAVERSLPQLESQLVSSGIKVDGFQITVNQPAKGSTLAQLPASYQSEQFLGRQRDGGGRQPKQSQSRLRGFALPEAGFDKVMINCLA